MTILELLAVSRNAIVQGVDTRLVVKGVGRGFIVLGRSGRSKVYSVELYNGDSESEAVAAYRKHEGE